MYLGYCGAQNNRSFTALERKYDWLCSKFGGNIQATQAALGNCWAESESSSSSNGTSNPNIDVKSLFNCNFCNNLMVLITQIHAPKSLCHVPTPPTGKAAIADLSVLSPHYQPRQGGNDKELRTLFIIACNNAKCWKLGKARYQPFVTKEEIAAKQAAFRSKLVAKQTPPATPKSSPVQKETKFTQKPLFSTPSWGMGKSSPFGSKSSSDAVPETEALQQLLEKRDLSITESLISLTIENSHPPSQAMVPDDDEEYEEDIDQEAETPSPSLSVVPSLPAPTDGFLEFYVEFDREPEESDNYGTDISHLEANTLDDLDEGPDGAWSGEKYESSTSAKDKPFHKFQKRLNRSPEQCLRYWRGAEPLYCAKDRPSSIPACSCGSRRVAELQLTPALVYLLHPIDNSVKNIEFGTVILYTCEANCTFEQHPLLEEFVYIQKGI